MHKQFSCFLFVIMDIIMVCVLSEFVVHLVIRNSAISYSLHVWNS